MVERHEGLIVYSLLTHFVHSRAKDGRVAGAYAVRPRGTIAFSSPSHQGAIE
jgi:hypothetical protein